MTKIKRLVLDVLKPHEPSIIELSRKLSVLKGITTVNCVVEEIDENTHSLKVTVEGTNINFPSIKRILENFGAAVHSIDSVTVGQK